MDYMKRAIELAYKGAGFVSPNPMVGAVIVKNNKIIGEGYHKKYGDVHAEINAFNISKEDVKGAEMYVTLEPCAHFGKTPPCAYEIIKKGIKKVYIGSLDPNPLVAGKGVEILKKAGIDVETNVLKEECENINPIFFKFIKTKMPYVMLKSATSLDGKIATYTGQSKWISNEKSRELSHKLRHQFKAIMVGINTVLLDNPSLTARIENGINPIKIIVDSNLKTPLSSKVLNTENSSVIMLTISDDLEKISKLKEIGVEIIKTKNKNNKVDLTEAMFELGKKNIDSILLEGGGNLNFSMLEEKLVDKCLFFVAPKIIGGQNARTSVEGIGFKDIQTSITLKNLKYKNIENDLLIYGDVRK